MLSDKSFTKENLDLYLKELAKEFRKNYGKSMPAEIILTSAQEEFSRLYRRRDEFRKSALHIRDKA